MKIKLIMCVCAVALAVTPVQAAVLTFNSGNGPDANGDDIADPYAPDELVRFVPYDNKNVPNTPTAADFDAIINYQTFKPRSVAAMIAPSDINGWEWTAPVLPGNNKPAPVFNFVSKNIYGAPGASSLFGIPFFFPNETTAGHMLVFEYQVDNYLGFDASLDADDEYTDSVAGLFLNGTPLAGSIHHDPSAGGFMKGKMEIHGIGDLLLSNQTNYLFINVLDRQPSAGLVFAGRIQPNPEPATVVIWAALGAIGMTVGLRRRRK